MGYPGPTPGESRGFFLDIFLGFSGYRVTTGFPEDQHFYEFREKLGNFSDEVSNLGKIQTKMRPERFPKGNLPSGLTFSLKGQKRLILANFRSRDPHPNPIH